MRTFVPARLVLLGVAALLAVPLPGAQKKKAAPAPVIAPKEEPKEYTLFMGTDFSIPQGKEFYRVRDVVGGNFIIKVKDREIAIPMRGGAGNLKVDQGLKLTGTAARIDQLKADRSYTAENDPHLKYNAQVGAATGASAAAALSGVVAADTAMGAAGMRSVATEEMRNTGSIGAETQRQVTTSQLAASAAGREYEESNYQAQYSTFNNPGMAALELANELAEENFDAMRYSFDISSEVPLNRPYLVFIVRYHEKDKPTAGGTTITAKPIEPIGLRPTRINYLQTGMPVGFVVEECQVRLYDNGQEIATNIAPRRVAMNRDDAFEYMLIDHLSRLKDATVAPTPALGKLNEATKSRLNIDQLKQFYYVKVSPEGRALAAFRDEACSQPVDETVAAVISDIRFYPALEKGRAVEGVAKFAFHQLTI